MAFASNGFLWIGPGCGEGLILRSFRREVVNFAGQRAINARRLRLLLSVLVKGAVLDTESGVPLDPAAV
jgi:hypothetical protein